MRIREKNIIVISFILIGIVLIIWIVFFVYGKIDVIEVDNSDNGRLIINVIDGDTLDINGEIVRLLCVDAPENGGEGYEEAKNHLEYMVFGNVLRVDYYGKDIYNRSLVYLYVKNNGRNILINKEIIENGYGVLYEYNGTDCSLVR